MAAAELPQSRLLALPRELRDEIYTLAFESTEVDLAWKTTKYRNGGIVLACKQTYQETIDLYYKHTPFLAYLNNELHRWLIHLPHNFREALGELKISRMPKYIPSTSFIFFQDEIIQTFVARLKERGIVFGDGVIKCRSGLGPEEYVTWVSWPITDLEL